MESRNQGLKESGNEEFRDSWNQGIVESRIEEQGSRERRISSILSLGQKVAKIDLIFPKNLDSGRQAENLRNSETC